MTGVEVIPEGSMSPQGSCLPRIGAPRCWDQARFPLAASKEYTVSFSVAAKTCPEASRGWAYWRASTVADHACLGESSVGLGKPTPKRPALAAKAGQGASAVTGVGMGVGVAVGRADGD